jgi:hypothetical protein
LNSIPFNSFLTKPKQYRSTPWIKIHGCKERKTRDAGWLSKISLQIKGRDTATDKERLPTVAKFAP